MRALIALSALTLATPAFAGDCDAPLDAAATRIDYTRLAYARLGELLDLARISNGLGFDVPQQAAQTRPSSKTEYTSNQSRSEITDPNCRPNGSLPGEISPPTTVNN
ncbi:MAG: hypothetical protein H6737_08735 [Alphaproteobacteria bacterium]|nr:hypothetical protein [Alphaproteobacteria bacterium]